MKTKLLSLFTLLLVSIGAWGAEWSYDFFAYCTTSSNHISEGDANKIRPTVEQTADFSTNGTSFYKITSPSVNDNFGISGTTEGGVVTAGLWLNNTWGAETTGRIGLYASTTARIGFKNLTIGQTITIIANAQPTIETDGGSIVELERSSLGGKTDVVYGSKTRTISVWNTYIYRVTANGSQALKLTGGNCIYSINVSSVMGLRYETTKEWNFVGVARPYCDGNTNTSGVLWYENGTASYSGYALKNISDTELTYYVDADAKTAGTSSTYSPTKDLLFTFVNNENCIYIDKDGIHFSRTGITIKIKNLKKGQKLVVTSVGGANDRYPSIKTNLTAVSTWERSNAKTSQNYEAIVTNDGDVEFGAVDKQTFYITSIKIQDQKYGLQVQDIKWASLYLPFNATIPEKTKVYYARSTTNSSVTLSEINTSIPANTGVVVNAESGIYNFVETAVVPTALGHTNLFEGVTSDTPFTDSQIYVLAGSENEKANPVFKLYDSGSSSGVSLAAYKSYLPKTNVPNAGNAKTINFVFDGEATGINAIDNGKLTIDNNAPMYNLAGQRVGKNYKGVVIQNGKKFMNK